MTNKDKSNKMEADVSEIQVNGKNFIEKFSPRKIKDMVVSVGKQINQDYQGSKPVFVVVLKGSVFFAADLLREIDMECTMETVRAKSYGSAMESSGKVELDLMGFDPTNKDIILIEDIIDSGRTLAALVKAFERFKPRSIQIVTLLFKPQSLQTDIDIKYVGCEIGSDFVVGYGMDYAEKGRNLGAIYTLK